MNNKSPSQTPLVLSTIFASTVIAGSIVFFAMQFTQTETTPSYDSIEFENAITKGIQSYVEKESNKTQNNQADAQREQANTQAQLAKNVTPPQESDYIRGNPDAEVSLIEYSDFECPFCKRFHPTAKEILSTFDGKVNWIYRHLPLDFHNPLATKQALATECAGEQGGNDIFWKYTDKIYETTSSNGQGMSEAQLYSIAVELGLNKDDLITCVSEEKYLDKVKAHIANASAVGISGTPGNILYNNVTGDAMPAHGAQPFSRFEAIITTFLSK